MQVKKEKLPNLLGLCFFCYLYVYTYTYMYKKTLVVVVFLNIVFTGKHFEVNYVTPNFT